MRSFEYAGLATLLALLIGYPLAYVIAFRGGRYRNALLLLVIVPFFVTYLIRTLSWETILSDSGLCSRCCAAWGSCRSTAGCWTRRCPWWRGSPTTTCPS